MLLCTLEMRKSLISNRVIWSFLTRLTADWSGCGQKCAQLTAVWGRGWWSRSSWRAGKCRWGCDTAGNCSAQSSWHPWGTQMHNTYQTTKQTPFTYKPHLWLIMCWVEWGRVYPRSTPVEFGKDTPTQGIYRLQHLWGEFRELWSLTDAESDIKRWPTLLMVIYSKTGGKCCPTKEQRSRKLGRWRLLWQWWLFHRLTTRGKHWTGHSVDPWIRVHKDLTVIL